MLKKQKIIFFISVVIFCGLVFLSYNALNSYHQKDLKTVRKQEKEAWNGKVNKLLDKVVVLEKEVSTLSGDTAQRTDSPVDSKDATEPEEASDKVTKASVNIEDIEHRIASFFLDLDKKDYIKQYKLKGSSYNEYEISIEKMSSKPPLIVNETESLYNMFLNIAHFYRILGKKRLLLVRDVLLDEDNDTESTMRDFYSWYIYDFKNKKRIKGRPSPKVLYEYSCFFLNTIGGRNYMMRRDSKLRILTSYYSVLFLDRANDMKLNLHGVDIRPYLRIVFNDIATHTNLKFQKGYIKQINILKEKYSIE